MPDDLKMKEKGNLSSLTVENWKSLIILGFLVNQRLSYVADFAVEFRSEFLKNSALKSAA